MADWQERITSETAPAIRVEHELRYRVAAPLISRSAAWTDLGCGNGLAAAAALCDEPWWHSSPAPKAVLVDIQADAVQRAARELALPDALCLRCDLTSPSELDRIGEALLAVRGERVVSCFEVIEHLSSFVPLLQWCAELARAGEATFVVSVPNDAFWSIENPHHRSAWGEGAFEELRRLLPAEQTLLRQVALSGSAALDWETAPESRLVPASVGGEGTVTTHFIAAFGTRHEEVWRGALATQTDMLAQRRWERQREHDLAVMQQVALEHDRTVGGLREELRQRVAWFEEWRTYIHQLERELGRPLSGVSPEELPSGGSSSAGTDRAASDRSAGG